MSDFLCKRLELTRLELLDMGLRGNTLLNLRHTASTVPIVGESSVEIFRRLVLEQRAFRFAAQQPSVQELRPDFRPSEDQQRGRDDANPAVILNSTGDTAQEAQIDVTVPTDQTDLLLQTRLEPSQLEQRLLKISNAARGYFEEQGVEILFLALGVLEWSEDPSGKAVRRAPLVLVPVELQRVAAGHGFKLVYSGADLGPNLTLASKLKSEFRIELPLFEMDTLALDRYLETVRNAVASRPRWRVQVDEVCLGFFSFGKFQMYQDLDPDIFPADAKPWEHPVVKALLADGFDAPSDPVPGNIELTELNFVKDADTSQTEAALAVVQGSNLVIQGPPGTGKSQTITNIIAELLARGKTVLFVAEKMAALEVVKRRLDESHLGDAVLELHSHKSQRKSVIDELARCLQTGVPETPDRSEVQARHRQLQHGLDAYHQAVSSPVLKSGTSYVQALGEALRLSDSHDLAVLGGRLPFDAMRDWTHADFGQANHQVGLLVTHLREHGSPDQSNWFGVRLLQFGPDEQHRVLTLLAAIRQQIEQLRGQSSKLNELVTLTDVRDLTGAQRLVECFKTLRQMPVHEDLAGVRMDLEAWHSVEDFDQVVMLGRRLQALRQSRQSLLLEQAWDQNVLDMRAAWAGTGDRWWRLVSGTFRQARRDLQSLMKTSLPDDPQACLAILNDILAFQSLKAEFERVKQPFEIVFGPLWRDLASDWGKLESLGHWMHATSQLIRRGDLSAHQVCVMTTLDEKDRQRLWVVFDEMQETVQRLGGHIDDLLTTVQLDRERWRAGESGFDSLLNWLDEASSHSQDLYALSRFNQIESLLDNSALKELVARARCWGQRPPEGLLHVLQTSWYLGLVHEAYANRSLIAQFDRASHEHAVKAFGDLDRQLMIHAQERLVCRLHERLPLPVAVGEMGILRREMNKKRRHMALRQLIREAGRAIQQIKPVFMMSPMSVATYLEHGAVQFDVVIFDEASQVRVADALGALLRARQAVVVGDSRQMPPTDFFSRTLELDDEQAEQSQTVDIESVLGMFVAQGAPQKMLRWHYRSRHDSLIAVSNQAFYESQLLVFPTPGVHPQATGLRLHLDRGASYDRGHSRTNPAQARAVAMAVIEHARHTPSLSLGVVAFSTAQRDCLLLEIENLRRQNPDLESFFNQARSDGESFFVKNLENVQGDERDVIMISIGYGRTDDGHLIPNFGPINQDGGERRLNVLITRAKLAMEVFSNFSADELSVDTSTPMGVRVLQSLLAYAQTGVLDHSATNGTGDVGAFERYLCEQVRSLGYEPRARLGQSGFYIDIAVADPHAVVSDQGDPGVVQRYALAIQTDGVSYQATIDTRERERVRDSVLGSFGWQVHRVWSTDWLRSPKLSRERLRTAIESAIKRLHESVQVTQASSQAGLPKAISASDGAQTQTAIIDSLEPLSGERSRDEVRANDQGQPTDVVGPAFVRHDESQTKVEALSDAVTIERVDRSEQVVRSVPPYEIYQGSLGLPRHQMLHEALPESLGLSIRTLVLHEGPMHLDLIARRLAQEAGLSRLSSRVLERIAQGIDHGVRHQALYRHGEFVSAQSRPDVPLRSRSHLPALYRNIGYISPFELRQALSHSIGHSYGITTDEALSMSLSLLGFQRVTAKSLVVVKAVLDEMIDEGVVMLSQGKLMLRG